MRRLAIFLALVLATPAALPAARSCVFVLHGLARGPASMERLAGDLSAAGFNAINVAYPSRAGTFDTMVSVLREAVEAHSTSCAEMHFVGYSLGALIVRAYLHRSPPANLRRVVLIAPPNRGSQIIDAIGDTKWFHALMGPVAGQLGTGKEDLPQQLPPPRYPVGVIAGDRSINILGELLIPGAHDGTVAVESTRLEGMSDFLLVHRTHTFIMRAPEVSQHTVEFLRHGRFNYGEGQSKWRQ